MSCDGVSWSTVAPAKVLGMVGAGVHVAITDPSHQNVTGRHRLRRGGALEPNTGGSKGDALQRVRVLDHMNPQARKVSQNRCCRFFWPVSGNVSGNDSPGKWLVDINPKDVDDVHQRDRKA